MAEVEPVRPIRGHSRRGDGTLQKGAGAVAQTLAHFGAEFVFLVDIAEQALVDGVQIGDDELGRQTILAEIGTGEARRRKQRGAPGLV